MWDLPHTLRTSVAQSLTADTVVVQVAEEILFFDCIPPHRQGLDTGTLLLLL